MRVADVADGGSLVNFSPSAGGKKRSGAGGDAKGAETALRIGVEDCGTSSNASGVGTGLTRASTVLPLDGGVIAAARWALLLEPSTFASGGVAMLFSLSRCFSMRAASGEVDDTVEAMRCCERCLVAAMPLRCSANKEGRSMGPKRVPRTVFWAPCAR